MTHADLLYLAGGDEEAARLIDDVLAGGVGGVVRARALIHRVQHDAEPALAVARLEEAVVASAGDDVVRARALASLAWMRGVWGGDVDAAEGEAEAAVALAISTGDRAASTTALTTAAIIQTYRGDPRAERTFDRAIEMADGIEWIAGDRSPFVAAAHQRFWRADWSGAERLLDEERSHASRNGEESRLERLNIFEADLQMRRSRWDDADRLLEEALSWAGAGYWRARGLLWRALLRARRGDPRALEDVAEATASPATGEDPLLGATAEYALGLVALAEERPAEAADRLRPLPEVLERHGLREPGILVVAPDAVEALLSANDRPGAMALADRLDQRAEAARHPVGVPASARCRGLIALADGDIDAALVHLDGARRGFDDAEMRYEVARTRLIEGNALRRAGRRTAAAEALIAASETFGDLRARRWQERADQELRRARPRGRRAPGLTPAEIRVAALVVSGRTNKEVAAQLYTTVATVEAHLTRTYRKLGLRSRTELTRAVADGLVDLGSA